MHTATQPRPVSVSPLTPGTSPLGRGTEPGDDADAVATAKALLTGRHGLVDTSNNYSDGRSEQVLGAALAELGDEATAAIVTKVDVDPETGAFDRDRVFRSYDESLERLGLDRVGLLHLHDPYMVSTAEALGSGGAVEALIELRESGRVDAIGVAAYPFDMMQEYVTSGVFDAVLIHNRFTLVDQSAAPLFAEAKRRGMTVFNAAPFGAGLLAKRPEKSASYAYRPAPDELVAWAERAREVSESHGVALRTAALHFSVRSPLVDSTVVGTSSPQRLAQLDEMLAADIPDALWDELEELGPAPFTPHDAH